MVRCSLIGIFLLSVSSMQACVGERNQSKKAEVRVRLQSKATMQAIHQANATEDSTNRPLILTELYFCKAPEVLGDLQMGPWAHTLMMKSKGVDLTGSTWKIITFDRAVWPAIGIDAKSVIDFNDNDLSFAFVDPGPLFPSGGFVYNDRATKSIVGAQKVCDQLTDHPSYMMRFKKPVIVDTIPEEFSMGRMNKITLPALQATGAQRFTWVHKDVAVRNFQRFANDNIAYGGFLYTISRGGQNYLQFYERWGYPTSNAINIDVKVN